jgi:hypothetical protein
MFDLISHSVIKLRRVRIGPVTAEGILVGQWRHLTPAEVKRLKAAPPARKREGKGAARAQGEGGGARPAAKGGPRAPRKTAAGRRRSR